MLQDILVLGVYALLGVALFQIDFSAPRRHHRSISSRAQHGDDSFVEILRAKLDVSKDEMMLLNNESSFPQDVVTGCQESQCTPFRQLERTPAQYRDLPFLFTGSGLTKTTTEGDNDVGEYAVCEFQTMDGYNFHFPHTMQQIYRCWSWWRLNNQQQPVLVFPRSSMPENDFLQGFVASLEATIGLQLWKPNQVASADVPTVQPRVPNNLVDPANTFGMHDPTRPYYAMHQPDDAKVLRDTILAHLERLHTDGTKSDVCVTKPRIAILNRHKYREWTNAPAVAQQLRPDAAGEEIPMVFFEHNTTFADQVSFLRDTDVLISPHGAQLTGLPFMPDCGAVLEIFPVGYYLPYFFGSLAQASNLVHGYVSLTNGDWRTESAEGMQSQSARQKFRNAELCPNVETIVDAVQKLIQKRKACCERETTN